MKFRPCIDLHQGVVKQIVGGTLTDSDESPTTNFSATRPASWFAELYRKDNLTGGHVIQLGPGNEEAACGALSAWPDGLQVGGGITCDNAVSWLDRGAAAVIVTSHVFHDGRIDEERLAKLVKTVGKERLVLDLSCRRSDQGYRIVTDRWQTWTDEVITLPLLDRLADSCHEFLIHGVDVEGMVSGIEEPLVELLGKWGKRPVTYAGGIRSLSDIETIDTLGNGAIDFTVGSALDIFGGDALAYETLSQRYSG
ncbi:phosphoribosylformimino-5-aminoimidazole carboxamide ribotide isomerase [Desulfoluna butyratoxydans]|uniref:Phosphoribosylformimino-5-aminoimidazole carboxamide ribotide isomerase eukaryotic n=1 Tax=Desulfoluna butyratoxydans TaxID=231438 RepID=A0A4U8YIJ4_9BACT|nr:phosphoribosylformimino-5-aminoimidazole carboxamide ribotide isomerase [Desulfoluna butyratoxydans]VFQ43505.1 phosphoribosylformimino-5-aminoimidazole carboxamide ribotide isomerase eukaryotic [Desulfoluna butyratoxydans]